ncbi:MAG: hypothetical protein AAGD34_22695 [Pseudomonadota bacterium]
MKALTNRMRKIAFIVIAAVCLLVGLLTVWTPLPTGIPLIAVGIVLLVTVSATARRYLKRARERSAALDKGIHEVEKRAGRNMATMLKRTRPLARKIEAKAALKAANAAIHAAREKAKAKRAAKRKPEGQTDT